MSYAMVVFQLLPIIWLRLSITHFTVNNLDTAEAVHTRALDAWSHFSEKRGGKNGYFWGDSIPTCPGGLGKAFIYLIK